MQVRHRIACFLLLVLMSPALSAESPRWVLIGDSIIVSSKPDKDVRQSMAYFLERYHGVSVSLLAAGGQTMAEGAAPLLGGAVNYLHGPSQQVSTLVIALGTNDWWLDSGVGVPPDTFTQAYAVFLQQVPAEIAVYCVTPVARHDEAARNARGLDLDAYRDLVSEACSAAGATVLAGELVFDVVGAPDFIDDGVHLTPTGTWKYTQWLWRQIAYLAP